MAKYENLMRKANLCREAASRTTGRMRAIWCQKAQELQEKAASLLLSELI